MADPFHKHIVSGDIDSIVENKELADLLRKGPKYREPVPLNFEKAKSEIMSGIDDMIEKWCNKAGCDTRVMGEWRNLISFSLSMRIDDLRAKTKINKTTPLLKQKLIKEDLKSLHDRYVITPIDKASNNVAFICKRFYAKVLADELGLYTNSSSPTYVKCTKTENNLTKQHSKKLNSFKLKNTDGSNVLPKMYWIPKMHKDPIKFRFIVAAVKCSLKPLAKTITNILKRFYKQIETYNLKSKYYSGGINTFWVVQDKEPVLKAIKKINKRMGAKTISTFDFSTLYTKIPHEKLKYVLAEIVKFCYTGCKGRSIIANERFACWENPNGDNNNNKSPSFTHETILDAIDYLLDNSYFKVGDKIFRQVIGIPMGTDPAPFMANLFLYHYEQQHVLQLKKEDVRRARRLTHIFRFIDDLCVINDHGLFEQIYLSIYPEEMELKKENEGLLSATFLDLDINIVDHKFDLKLFDKRDAFPFQIVRMPYLSNNMPSNIFYSTLSSELLRIARCTTDKDNFLVTAKTLISRMKKQGATMCRLISCLKRLYGNHMESFSRFFKSSEQLVSSLV